MLLNLEESKKAASAKRIFGWPLKALVSLAVLWLVFILAGRVLRPIAIAQIAELTNTKISVKSIDFNLDGSVFIKELVVRPNQKQTDSDAILKAKRVYARFGIGSLLLLKPRLKEITVNDFIFNAQHNLDTGKWNLSALKIRIPAGGSRKIPFVNLESGTLQYSKVSNGRAKVVAAVPLDVTFAPDGKDPCACIFSITTAKRPGFGEGILAGSWKPGRITASGGISSADVPVFERAWAVNFLDAELDYEPEGAYSLKLKIKDLLGTPVSDRDIFAFDKLLFLEKFSPFNTLQRFFNRYRPWGHIDIDLEVSGSLQKLAESTLHGKVYCKNVSICHRKFPYPVEIFGGQVDLTERSVSLNNLSGRHKDVKLFFNGWSKDFGPNRQYQFKITSDNMALDSDLYDALTAKQKKFWSVFSPSGLAVIDYRLTQRSQTDKEKILAVELLDAQAAYQHFPYPLKNLAGRLLFDHNSVVASDLVSQYNGSKITLNGTVTACRTDRPICDISVRAENIPLDSTLAAALPAGQRDLYNQYNMAGQGDADVKVFTPEGDVSPTSFIADVSFEKASLKLNQCPLPVSDISAKAVFTPDFVRIDNFIGRYGQALVSVTGRMWPAETQQSRYCLSLLAKGLELNDELFSLLPTPLEQIVSKVQPAGKVDIAADLNKGGGDDCPDYQITVNCLGSSVGFGQLPCPLKDITGSLTVTEDSITLSDIVATASNVRVLPTDSTVKVNGRIALADGAFSDGRFRFSADCYSGRLAGKFQLRQPAEADLEYLLQLGFDNIDLKQFLSEPKQTLVRLATLSDTNPEETRRNSYTSGKMSGSLSITATVGEDLPHIGRCRLWMTDMQVGKLSLLAKLLQVLKLTEPKDFAFDRMFIDSYIMHNKLFFEEFDLSGESVAFNGSGWMDLQTQNVDLTLFARGQRIATEEPSILQSLTEGLGTAVVRMEVSGNVYEPQVKTRALPVIKDSLQILGTKPVKAD